MRQVGETVIYAVKVPLQPGEVIWGQKAGGGSGYYARVISNEPLNIPTSKFKYWQTALVIDESEVDDETKIKLGRGIP